MIEPITETEINDLKKRVRRAAKISRFAQIFTTVLNAVVFVGSTIITLKWHTFTLIGVILLINLIIAYANKSK